MIENLNEFNFSAVIFRLLLAMAFGGMIGIERGAKHRPAGFRTYMLVSLGAALTILLGEYELTMLSTSWADIAREVGIKTDISRFGAQVINGIGFLGAGTIIVTGRQQVTGLTTAAGLWASAIIGLAFGGGFYEGGLLVTILILVAELFFSKLEYHILKNSREINVYMEYSDRACLDRVLRVIRQHYTSVLNLQITRPKESKRHKACVIFSLRINSRFCTAEQLLQRMSAVEGVDSIEEL